MEAKALPTSRIVITPDDVILPGERRHFKGQTFGDAGLTLNIYSPCYPYRCCAGCPHETPTGPERGEEAT